MKLIDKAALVAEIENKIKKYTKRGEESDAKRDGYGIYWGGVLSCLNEVRTLCDTFETKEVNLNSESAWKSADGDDLPEIDKEVIALIEAFGHYKVIFAHRVDENAEIHTSIDGKPLVLHPKKHGKGGWNIPDLKFWLDCELPKIEE